MVQLWEGAVLVFSALHVLTGYFLDASSLGEWEKRRGQGIASKVPNVLVSRILSAFEFCLEEV